MCTHEVFKQGQIVHRVIDEGLQYLLILRPTIITTPTNNADKFRPSTHLHPNCWTLAYEAFYHIFFLFSRINSPLFVLLKISNTFFQKNFQAQLFEVTKVTRLFQCVTYNL